MKVILLTTYFCIVLQGALSKFVNDDTDIEVGLLDTLQIPPDYKEHRGDYYKLYTEKKSWDDARAVCKTDGADLATVESRDEALYLKSLLGGRSSLEYPGAWIGFRDTGVRKWTTIESKSLEDTGYNTWWPWSSKIIGGCGTIKTCSRYDVRDCMSHLMFICKYKI